jgi:transposase InsO family protein
LLGRLVEENVYEAAHDDIGEALDCKRASILLFDDAGLLAGEQFSTLHEAKMLIEQWRRHYNAIRPHSSLGYRPPSPETILPSASALAYAALRPAQSLATSGRILT